MKKIEYKFWKKGPNGNLYMAKMDKHDAEIIRQRIKKAGEINIGPKMVMRKDVEKKQQISNALIKWCKYAAAIAIVGGGLLFVYCNAAEGIASHAQALERANQPAVYGGTDEG